MTDITTDYVAERLELIDSMLAMFDLAMRTEGIDYKVRQRISNRVMYGSPERGTYTLTCTSQGEDLSDEEVAQAYFRGGEGTCG